MKLTNKQLLIHTFDGKPKLKPEETGKFDSLFTPESLYNDTKRSKEKGWCYANVTNKDLSAYIALGFDDLQRYFFHELRYKGKTYKIGEGFSDKSTKFFEGGFEIKEPEREVVWKGVPSEYEVVSKIIKTGPTSEGELKITYKFEKLSDEIKKFKCIFKEFDQILAYWMISPAKGSLEIEGKGDISLFNLGEAEELIGKNISSNFSYNENIHMRTPMISEGWHWTILDCYQEDEQKIDKIVSFMHFFFQRGNYQMPLYLQLIVWDPNTGESEVFDDLDIKLKWESEKTPLLSVKSKEGKIELKITPKYEIDIHSMKGVKLANLILKTDIDYNTYPCNAEVTIGDKKFNAIGSSEICGAGRSGYWI